MAQNKNALIRYKTIDKCLQNRYRNWTLEDLIEACSEALFEYEGREVYVSKRTVQLDIQLMRSDKLGYNAPIEVFDRKFYRYSDEEYSITNIPLTDTDMQVLFESVEMLKQFKDFSLFSELGDVIHRLEDKIYTEKTKQRAIIHLDKNEKLKGLEHLDTLYQAILKKTVLVLQYQSFKAREVDAFHFHPFLLKEFNNRWFLIGKKSREKEIQTLALDRIVAIDFDTKTTFIEEDFDGDEYYKHTVGVSVLPEKYVEDIVLLINSKMAPYVLTKPMHHTQEVIEKYPDRSVKIRLRVHRSFELERLILGYGEEMQVLEPLALRLSIENNLKECLDRYKTLPNAVQFKNLKRKFDRVGFYLLSNMYTGKEIRKINALIEPIIQQKEGRLNNVRAILKDNETLFSHVFNTRLKELIRSIQPEAKLVKSIYFDKSGDQNWVVNWHQDIPINVSEKKEIDGFSSWVQKDGFYSVLPPEELSKKIFTLRIHLDDVTVDSGALKVIPLSHKKRLTTEQTTTLLEHVEPVVCQLERGGVMLMRPLLLHASGKNKSKKKRRILHLEFSAEDLPGSLEWAEEMELKL